MPNLAAKTRVSKGACGGCGRPVGIILNKNGNAYYMCGWSNDQGQPCGHHERWGKTCSQQFQRDFLENRKAASDASDTPAAIPAIQPANDTTAPGNTPPSPTSDADGPKQPAGGRGRAFGRRRSA